MKSATRRAAGVLAGLAVLLAAVPSLAAESRPADAWAATLDRVSKAVVAISVSGTRGLDTEGRSHAEGSGFVVDRERGLILTNRHIVRVGPVRAKGVLLNQEEIELFPVYRDPIHDFGFFRFDPNAIRHFEIGELPLAAGAAKVGAEIKVVGNDGGQKMSILSGTLSRVDRPAPRYGSNGYNDFNTFYLQASTSSSGGSSGAPVVNKEGLVVGIQAGAHKKSTTSFYVPVDRALLVLGKLKKGERVRRGTLQAVYELEPFDELKRLGLPSETETAVRKAKPASKGMFVVKQVVPGGPAEGTVEVGDVLFKIDGAVIDSFNTVEDRLDEKVGSTVDLLLARGNREISATVRVDDLDVLTPSKFLEVSSAVLQNMSLQIALNRNVKARGVLVTDTGYAFRKAWMPREAVIVSVDGKEVENIDEVERLFSETPDGGRMLLRYVKLEHPREERVTMFAMDRKWFPANSCTRNDGTGFWDCVPIPGPQKTPPAATPLLPIEFSKLKNKAAAALAPSLVYVQFWVPYYVEGVGDWSFSGAGLVVDAEKGLVVADRAAVPILMGDAELTFAGSVRVPAEVVFLHPVHNLAILRYDPERLIGYPVKSVKIAQQTNVPAGTAVNLVGLTYDHQVVAKKTQLERVDYSNKEVPSPPQFREYNLDFLRPGATISSVGGAITTPDNEVLALWADDRHQKSRRFYPLPIEVVARAIHEVRNGKVPRLRTLGAEVTWVSLARATELGLPREWVEKLLKFDQERRQAIQVVRVASGTSAAKVLADGDLVLAIDGVPVTRARQVDEAVAGGKEEYRVTRLRVGKVEEVSVRPVEFRSGGIERALFFAGGVFHDLHPECILQYGVEPGGLYISAYWNGGPAARHDLGAAKIVREVDGKKVRNLDEFLAVVKGLKDRESLRLKIEYLTGTVEMKTVELDLVYWPTYLLERGKKGWAMSRVE